MSNFFKILFGSCLGTLLALGAMFFIGFSAIVGLASSGEQKPAVENNSILKLDLTQVPELTGNVDANNGFAGFELDMDEVVGVHDVIRTIERAKTDDNIKGIYLNSGIQAGGFTKLRMIREALADFRESGKFVVSYAPYYDQSAYYLSTAADEIYVGPLGVIDFRGIGGEIMFYKGMMEKIGVDVEVFYAGQFKSATEPFRRKNMSDQNREQTREFLGAMFTFMVDDIAEARGLSSADIRNRANTMAGWKGEEAVTGGLIDGIKRRSEVDARLRELIGFESDQKLKTISHEKYFSARLSKLKGRGNSEVAVLIAEGSIVDGKGANGSIGDTKYVREIEKLTEDDDVKAVVLRVNSGGGSASSSENIWYAAEQLKAAGKPFVVSMGSVAASGGYYVAAGADSIFAEPSTITGSIGVFMMFPKDDGLMEGKLGLTTDTVNTAKHANGFSPFRPLAEEERAILQQRTKAIYATFLDRVAEGRDIPLDRVKEIAQGRVYAGNRALEIGLVDRLAGLDEAIASASRMAGLDPEDISVGHYPKIKPPIEQLIEDLLGEDAAKGFGNAMLKDQLGDKNYEYFQMMREMTQTQGVQARMPVKINF
ncbi:MAG: signal peptide peptidase SppA [Lewinella sp.]